MLPKKSEEKFSPWSLFRRVDNAIGIVRTDDSVCFYEKTFIGCIFFIMSSFYEWKYSFGIELFRVNHVV